MKKVKGFPAFLAVLLTLCVLLTLPVHVAAEATAASAFDYELINSGKEVMITGLNESVESVEIPSKIDGKKVSAIGESAFKSNANLESIIIPDSVTYIGDDAFADCKALSGIVFPSALTYLGSGALDGTAWYNKRPDGVVYAGGAAYTYKGKMSKDTNLVIRKGTTAISPGAFKDQSKLVSVTIPDTVTVIEASAFEHCTGLKSVNFGDEIERIGDYAFYKCSKLNDVTIPDSVTYIGEKAFANCNWLSAIEFSDELSYVGYGAFDATSWYVRQSNGLIYLGNVAYTYKGTIAKGSDDSEITLNSWTQSISPKAFYGQKYLVEIDMYNTDIETVGASAFQGCTGLKYVELPSETTSIEDNAFAGCTSLVEIDIPDGVTSIGDGAFKDCSALDTITSFGKVKYIGSLAFANCVSLTGTLALPTSVKTIEYGAFSGCLGLTKIDIKGGATSIGERAFFGCLDLKEITGLDNVTYVGVWAFEDTLWYNKQASGLVYVGKCAYAYKGKISQGTEITIKDGTVLICERAFYGKSGLESVTIPASVKEIGAYAFAECTGLKEVAISEGVETIGKYAFVNCTNYLNITIPESVKKIGKHAFGYYTKENVFSSVSYKKFSDVKIYCYEDTAGHKYAKDNSFKFELLDETIVEETTVESTTKEEPTTAKPVEPTTAKPVEPTTTPPVVYDTELELNKDSALALNSAAKTLSNLAAGTKYEDFIKNFKNDEVIVKDKNGKVLSKGDLIGTSATVSLLDQYGSETDILAVIVKGDVDGDGKITAADARKTLRASAGLEKLEGVYFSAANTGNAEKLTASDARKILRVSADLESFK